MKFERKQLNRTLAAAGLSLLLPLMAFASPQFDGKGDRCQHRAGGIEHRHGMMDEIGGMPLHLRGLNLDDAQRDAVFRIMHAQAPAMHEKHKALRKASEAMRELSRGGKFDEAASRRLAQDIADNTAAIALLRAHAEHDIHALLTPEQRKQAEARKSPDDFRPVHAQGRHRDHHRRFF